MVPAPMTAMCFCAMVLSLAVNSTISHRVKRAVEVLDEVAGVFETDGQTNQSLVDAQRLFILRGKFLMRGGRGMSDEALGVAEIVGNLDDAQRILEAERASFSARNNESDQIAAAGHLAAREGVLRMAFEAGVERARNLWVL